MKFISHRGNIDGINPERENTVEYILEALSLGFDVEIDVWVIDGNIYLGHDNPVIVIENEFLENEKLWCHAKNLESLNLMLQNPKIHCFWHENDVVTLTSNNFVWAFPGNQPIKNSIAVLPERYNDNISECYGICSDFVLNYKNKFKNML